jgi:threonylcarbamoyladenosine tRNA methylthiotransferase MtaB
MKVFLDTLGCRLNEAELESWARGFVRAGHSIARRPVDADLLVLNTCAVTGEAERKSRQEARRLHRRNPSAPIVLTGCFAELETAREDADPVTSTLPVDLVVRNPDKDRLVEIVLDAFASDGRVPAMPVAATDTDATHLYPTLRTRAFIKVQDGCRHRCTFCIVTVARGAERSRPIPDVVEEIRMLEATGHREAVLSGVHLGGYGTDLGTTLDALVGAVLERTSIPRVRLSSLEPWDLPSGFFAAWQNERLMPHLHLPLQSGSDAVLHRMGRRCDVASFTSLAHQARATIEGLTLTTDLIVGFPGETDADFDASLRVLETIGFGHVHLFTYSPREGTAAARRSDQVPAALKRERMARAKDVVARLRRAHRERFVGQTRPVLWEHTLSDGDPDGPPRWSGHTDNYLRVVSDAASGDALRNAIEPVRLSAVEGDDLVGERPSRRPAGQVAAGP